MTIALGFHDIDALARQAVDLLSPDAVLTITETPRTNAYVYPQATGGDHGAWRVAVTLAADNHTSLVLDAYLSRAAALGQLLTGLAAASGGRFRGTPFPPCPDHRHQAVVRVQDDRVCLDCPVEHSSVTLFPVIPKPA